MTNNTMLGTLNKVEDVVYFVTHRNLFGYFEYCIFKAKVASVDDAVGVGNVAYDAFGRADVFQYNSVYAVV